MVGNSELIIGVVREAPRNRLVGHVPQKDLANDVMDQNQTSGEFGLPTSTERPLPVQVAMQCGCRMLADFSFLASGR